MFDELVGEGLFWLICNVIGGTIRWVFGSIWRTVFKKPKFKYKEYLFGIDKTNSSKSNTHQLNNLFITLLTLFLLGYLLS